MTSTPITQEMTIPEIVEKFPRTREVFKQYGIQVDGYEALKYENLSATTRVHQIDLQTILSNLNKVADH